MSKVEEIERAVDQLPLKDLAELAARIDRRRRELARRDANPAHPVSGEPAAGGMILRDHSAFLSSYAPEDEGLYDDAAAR